MLKHNAVWGFELPTCGMVRGALNDWANEAALLLPYIWHKIFIPCANFPCSVSYGIISSLRIYSPGVYVILCADCAEALYFKVTEDNLLQELQRSLLTHIKDKEHFININGVSQIYQLNYYRERRIVESCFISSYPNINMSAGQYSFNCVIKNISLTCIKYSNTYDVAPKTIGVGVTVHDDITPPYQ